MEQWKEAGCDGELMIKQRDYYNGGRIVLLYNDTKFVLYVRTYLHLSVIVPYLFIYGEVSMRLSYQIL